MQNILFVGAHHDDLELSIGASVKRWTGEGKKVCSAVLTTSEWKRPDGKIQRNAELAQKHCEAASKILGYKPFHLGVSRDFELRYDDAVVVELLRMIDAEKIDTLITIWPNDAHPTHRMASAIAFAATRKVPNVLTARVSWNSVPEAFKPSFFVDVSTHLDSKIRALKCYEDEYARTGELWERFVKSSATLYGLESNCEYAEAFEVVKFKY